MLAILHSRMASAVPEELRSVREGTNSDETVTSFVASYPNSVSVKVGGDASMAYSHCNQSILRPRAFGAKDECFCVFVGTLTNLVTLRQQYGLSKTANEVMVVIEAYRTLRDRAPFPPSKMVGHLEGNFAFVVFDSRTGTAFSATDSEGKVDFFWGVLADGCLVFSDQEEVMKFACGKSFSQFPPAGLQSYEFPKQKIMAISRKGEENGGRTMFRVVMDGVSDEPLAVHSALPGYLDDSLQHA
eukprot:TRINITY_DN8700_c0_g1_i1.p1 TRINITY_DN8700_c0_g1~~TRINITY_DN8700_c0_g1_i1.p1  ORF type:complete len:243 (-),score=49.36 TRINITY_DN8700_c0_g1_i1:340-1068(-)